MSSHGLKFSIFEPKFNIFSVKNSIKYCIFRLNKQHFFPKPSYNVIRVMHVTTAYTVQLYSYLQLAGCCIIPVPGLTASSLQRPTLFI